MRTLLACAAVLLGLLGLVQPVNAAQRRSNFDHLTTGFELLGRHRELPCEACHVNAVFKGTPRDCVSCHGAGTAVRATAKPTNHILTTDRCAACHTPAAWLPAVNFDHTQTLGSCSSCHNSVQAQGMGAQHTATTQQCNACHTTLGWAGALFNHAGITSGCAKCHDGATATGLPANHIPTNGAQCEDCHLPTEFSTFLGAVMDHPVVASIPCSTCHEAGRSFAGTPPVTTRPPLPHSATGACSSCHTTANWNATDVPPNHIPIPAAEGNKCSLCHSNDSDFSVYVMNHVNIAGNCAQCHGPGLSFANMAPPTLQEPPLNHIPYNGAPCEDCHSPTLFTTFNGSTMDHAVVTSIACTTCHEAGKSFAGTPVVTTRPPPSHPATGECSNCHTTSNWDSGNKRQLRPPSPLSARSPKSPAVGARGAIGPVRARVSAPKSAVGATLATLQGTTAAVMPSALTSRFVEHSQLTGACITCHNGRTATGTAGGHLGFSTRCDSCHTTNAWLPARVDHLAMAARSCSSCHNGVRAMGKPGNHVPTIQPCSACHGTLAWQPVRVNHLGVVNGCAKCHNNVAAVGLTITHFRTQLDCSACHRYPDWGVIVFRHASVSIPAARSRGLACTACHTTNTEQVTSPNPGAKPAGAPRRPGSLTNPPALTRHPIGNAPF